ncbi:MAG: hypothetical protein ABS63_00145 [Microbacterium sp. SCN 70-27]|uniref:phosphorylase family protein n=1 Tax=unclassified Microbacterium TaxID=2609290 RepID=UPI00086BEE9D|nr:MULTISPECIES: hypothetical protein [unclassified Microbacterium]MBN9224948.1 hypothetical protein [Microbacterium sp.]ODT29315.1 MAG: hypothetical protein ABS63_00145 [Microbacterium sp. SCN 70-27]
MFRVLVVTPQLVEYRAIVQSFRAWKTASRRFAEDRPDGARECRIALDDDKTIIEFDVIKPPRVGRTEAAIAVTRYFDRSGVPDLVLVAGGAGGLGLRLGSCVIAREVLDIATERRTGASGVEFRASTYACDPLAVSVFQAVAIESRSEVTVGQVLSSDYVVASSQFRDSLGDAFPRVVAVEMEAGGVALAIERAATPVPMAVVRSIVDMSDENKRTDSDLHAGPSYLRLGDLIARAVRILAGQESAVGPVSDGEQHHLPASNA